MSVTETCLHFVDGEWTESETGETFETHNPAASEELVATYPQGSPNDAACAIDAANNAAETWAETSGPERGRILSETGRILADRKMD